MKDQWLGLPKCFSIKSGVGDAFEQDSERALGLGVRQLSTLDWGTSGHVCRYVSSTHVKVSSTCPDPR